MCADCGKKDFIDPDPYPDKKSCSHAYTNSGMCVDCGYDTIGE